MNGKQRLLVVVSLIVIGLVLALLSLEWGDEYDGATTRILVFYERADPQYRNVTDHIGIYTRYGLGGILMGAVAPICLFALAAFLALGGPRRTQISN